ncbi:hypothetical protein ACFLTT_00620 [Chloroflexota bacterium]
MKVLKSLALSLLSFLLFLSLSIFGTVYMFKSTLLNPDFVTAEINRLDLPELVGEITEGFFDIQGTDGEQYLAILTEATNETITEVEPWIKEQLNSAIYSSYDYLLGNSENINLTISTEPFTDSLKENTWESFQESPPLEMKPILETMTEKEQKEYFDVFYQPIDESIPATIDVTENSLPQDALDIITQVRQYASYAQPLYIGLIIFMSVIVLGIILIIRRVKDVTRYLGVPLLTYGAFGYASIFAAKYFYEKWLPLPEVSPSLEAWMPQFTDNIMAPMEIFSLSILITGIVLIVISFVYRKDESLAED